MIPAAELDRATAEADAKGVDQSIKDGLDVALPTPSSEEEEVRDWDKVCTSGDETTDVEVEMGGTRRPKRGEGHWGTGPPKTLRDNLP